MNQAPHSAPTTAAPVLLAPRRRVRTPRLVIAAAGVALALTGCAAGQHAQTVAQIPVTDGVSADSGTIGLRAASILAPPSGTSYAKGDDAELKVTIVNSGTAADTLVSVTATGVAGSAVVSLDGPPAGAPSASSSDSSSDSASDSSSDSAPASSSASDSASDSSSASASSSDSASSSASSSASPSASASSSAPTSQQLPVPANSRVSIGTSQTGPEITLIGLTQQLFPAQTATVTFAFASGANLTVTLPVQLTAGNTGGPTVDVSPSEG